MENVSLHLLKKTKKRTLEAHCAAAVGSRLTGCVCTCALESDVRSTYMHGVLSDPADLVIVTKDMLKGQRRLFR